MEGYIQCAESEKMQPRILYPARPSFKIEGWIKSFPDKQKLKEFVTTKPDLPEILRVTLWRKKKQKPKSTKTRKDQRTPPETPTLQASLQQ